MFWQRYISIRKVMLKKFKFITKTTLLVGALLLSPLNPINTSEASTIRYDIDTQSTLTADELNQFISSKAIHTERKNGTTSILRGQGQTIIDVAQKYGLNVHLFVGQIAYESGWGASLYSVNYTNLGGVKCMKGKRCGTDSFGQTVTLFDSPEDSIDAIGNLLREHYLDRGYDNLVKISERYVNGTTLNNVTTGVPHYMDGVMSIAKSSGANFNNIVGYLPTPEEQRIERERLEQERIEKERKEQERLEHERLEKERLEKERLEKERLEKERKELERKLEQLKLLKIEQLEKETDFHRSVHLIDWLDFGTVKELKRTQHLVEKDKDFIINPLILR